MDFNSEPYWDDFEASNGAKDKNYMRVLFRPGYAVQARELTQIQSIIQNQLKNFADHIFKDGSPVYGGHITLDTDITYLKLEQAYGGVDIDVTDFSNAVIFNSTGAAKIRAKVTAVDESQTQPTLMVRYLRGTEFSAGSVITTPTGSYAQLVASSASGKGSVASIDEGVFYVDGYFVKVSPQTIVLDAYNKAPTYRIGLEIDDNIIDESADANLLDPAQSSFNYQAPGGHRYQFTLNLAKRSLESVDDQKFFELLRVENGIITKQVYYPMYSEIEKTLARRTYDESGDYLVKEFGVSVEANNSNTLIFTVNVEPGKAYVKGYEFETQGTEKLNLSKARVANTSVDYDLSLEYGNYLIANNFVGSAQGFFDLAALQQMELHCVPRSAITTTNAGTYNATLMGTTRIVNFDRYNNTEYLTYLVDTNIQANTFVAPSLALNTTSILFPATHSTYDNAYANVLVRIASGNSSGELRKIISYNGAYRTATVDRNFPYPIEATANVVLMYDSRNIGSLIEPPSPKSYPLTPNSSIDVGLSSKDIYNQTVIYDSNRNSLLFKLPENYVANASITNADYVTRKYYIAPAPTGSNGEIDLVLTGGETFNYGTDGQLLSNSVANTNMLVTVRSIGTATNVAVGQIVNITGPRTGVRRLSSTQMKIYTDANGTFTPEVIYTAKVNNSESAIRSKTIIGDAAVTALRATDVPTNGSVVVGNSSVRIDTSNGFVWFSVPINSTSGGNTSLYVSDVFKIKKVYDSGNTAYAPSAANVVTDITDRFYLDSGQNKMYYDHSKLVLKPGAASPKGQIVVMLQYYQHSGTGYFTVDSYPTSHYAAGTIPVLKDGSGASFNLRDCIDFRPTRQIGTSADVTTSTFTGMKTVKPTESMELTYSYYLPRTDKIVLTKDKEFKVLVGTPSRNPIPPNDLDNAMTLFKVDIPPYTADVRDVKITTLENKRYTMRDIGNLDTRIKNVEYYTALSLVEKKAADTTILYEDNATEKEKYGIVTDNFTGFKVADFSSDDFSAGIDSGMLLPYSNLAYLPLDFRTIGTYAKKNRKTISLSYTEIPVIEQSTATTTVSIQPYLYGIFDGTLRLIPESDSWFSVSLTPSVISPADVLAPITTTTVTVSPLTPTTTTTVVPTGINNLPSTIPVDATGVFGSSPTTTVINTWFNEVTAASLGMNSGSGFSSQAKV